MKLNEMNFVLICVVLSIFRTSLQKSLSQSLGQSFGNMASRMAKNWVDSQLKLIEGTIVFVGRLHEDLDYYLTTVNDDVSAERKDKLNTLEKFNKIKNRAYELLHKNGDSVNNILAILLATEKDEPLLDGPDELKQKAQEVVKNLADFSHFYFTYMPAEGTRLFKKLDPNYNETEVREKMREMDPLRKNMNEKLANVSQSLGMETPFATR